MSPLPPSSIIRRPSSVGVRLSVLLLFALLLRLAFLFFAGVNAPLTGDELAYQQIAENVASGRGLFQTNNPFFPGQTLYAWQAPLYPLALGLLYEIFGNHILIGKLFGILVSTATVFIVYDLTRRVFRFPIIAGKTDESRAHQIAFAAALLVAIYPGFLTNAHLLLSETQFIFFLMLACDLVAWALERGKNWQQWILFAAGGAAWGLATLTRGLTLYFTPLFALWIGYILFRRRRGVRSSASPQFADASANRETYMNASASPLPRAFLSAFLFFAATALILLPYSIRNYTVFGQFVLLETKGGVNLWLGNSPYTPNNFIRNVWKTGVREPMLNALPHGELAQDRAGYALALNYIRSEPLTFLARMPIKFADFWGFERNLIDNAQETADGDGWHSISKLASDLFALVVYIFVMLWGIAGFLYARDDAWKILFGGFVLYFLSIHLILFGDGRFHLPLIPFFAIYAGWMLVMPRRIDYSFPRVALAILLAAFLLIVWGREAWFAWQVLRAG
ncbi:MAG TPA: glycosyltransferase family 39 protein [Anaerolineae bacterium]|nr:glycosyltransferase family 39 protein [Anaerolineae bacterium]